MTTAKTAQTHQEWELVIRKLVGKADEAQRGIETRPVLADRHDLGICSQAGGAQAWREAGQWQRQPRPGHQRDGPFKKKKKDWEENATTVVVCVMGTGTSLRQISVYVLNSVKLLDCESIFAEQTKAYPHPLPKSLPVPSWSGIDFWSKANAAFWILIDSSCWYEDVIDSSCSICWNENWIVPFSFRQLPGT